jgi:hypothetical protein
LTARRPRRRSEGFLGLFDRERGTALGITFFDCEEAIRGSEQAFEV